MEPKRPPLRASHAVWAAALAIVGLGAIVGWGLAVDRKQELAEARRETDRGRIFRNEFHPRLSRGLSFVARAELYWRAGRPAFEIDGRIEAALGIFEQLLEFEPESDDIWAARARTRLLQYRYEEAIRELEPFLARHPRSIARFEYTMARVLLHLRRAWAVPADGRDADTILEERRLQALRATREFIELRDVSEHIFLAGALMHLLETRPAQAAPLVDDAEGFDATSPHVALARAWLAAATGQPVPEAPIFPRAVEPAALRARTAEEWTAILEVDPDYAEAHLARSRLVADGTADAARAVDLDPTLSVYARR